MRKPDAEDARSNPGDRTGRDNDRPAIIESTTDPGVAERTDNLESITGCWNQIDLLNGVFLSRFQPDVEVIVDTNAKNMANEC